MNKRENIVAGRHKDTADRRTIKQAGRCIGTNILGQKKKKKGRDLCRSGWIVKCGRNGKRDDTK